LAILTIEECEIPVSLSRSPVNSYLSLAVLLGCKLSHPTRCLSQFLPNDDDHYQAAFQLDP